MMKLLFTMLILPLISCQETCTASSSCEEAPPWHRYTIDDLFQHFNCHALLAGYNNVDGDFDDYHDDDAVTSNPEHRELHPSELQKTVRMLETIRSKYIADIHLVSVGEKDRVESVFEVPVAVGDAGPKGRGVFAKHDIPRGTLLLDIDSKNVGVFKDAMRWRIFTYELGAEDAETACNFMEWCWVQNIKKRDVAVDDATATVEDDIRYGPTVFVAFDESGLINNAEWGEEEANLRCGTLLDDERDAWSECRFLYHASKDIAAGDEILMNYSEFEDEDQRGWVEFGVGIGVNI